MNMSRAKRAAIAALTEEILTKYAKAYYLPKFRFGPKCLFNLLTNDVLNLLMPFLVIPEDDPKIVELLALRKSKVANVRKVVDYPPGKRVIVRMNKHYGLHPVTAQHRWLRVLAQTCKAFRDIVWKYRELANANYCRIHRFKPHGVESFLEIEKKMTKQASSHNRRVKKSKRPGKPWIIRVERREKKLLEYKESLTPEQTKRFRTKLISMERKCMHPFQYYLKYIATTYAARKKRAEKLRNRPFIPKVDEDVVQQEIDDDIDEIENRVIKIRGKRYK